MSRHPDDPLDRFQRDVEQLFHGLIYHRHPSAHFCEAAWVPSVDVLVTENSARVILELAGVPRENVRVTLQGKVLEIIGRRDPPRESRVADYHRAEIFFGEFRRTVELPWEADQARVDARYRNGMLDILLYPVPATTPTDITVEGPQTT
jgi:HSP20 family protein